MAFDLKDCIIISKEEVKNYFDIKVKPKDNPVCPGCGSIYLTPDTYPEYKIFTVVDGRPAKVTFMRTYHKCLDCGKRFFCDGIENQFGVNRHILPDFRDAVISNWLQHREQSLSKAADLYGIDDDTLREWVRVLVDAFDDNLMIDPSYETLYLGSFRYSTDPGLHGFVMSEEGNKGFLLSFIDNYTCEGIANYIKNHMEKSHITQLRYDYVPGLTRVFQRVIFPQNSDIRLIINRQDFRRTVSSLLSGYEKLSELPGILGNVASDQNTMYNELGKWVDDIPASYAKKEEVRDIVDEVREANHLYNALAYPMRMLDADNLKKVIKSKPGRKPEYAVMKLQILYKEERWKKALQEAGSQKGYNLSLMTGFGNSRKTSSRITAKYTSKLRVTRYEISGAEISAMLDKSIVE